MIEPYNAVGLIPTFWGIRRRADIKKNLDHLHSLTKAAFWLSNLDIPVRLLAIPEGALMGFNDEVLDVDHAEYARTCCIDIPGPETDDIGKLARQWKVYIMAQAKARHKDWKDRFFNVGFIVDPDGKIILQHYKLSALLPVERSVSPHDVYDWWIEKHGRTLDAFWPVADTALGRLGVMMAMEGNFPENGRGLALNGAEVVYRASLPAPFTETSSRSPTAPAPWRTTSTSSPPTSAATTSTRTTSTSPPNRRTTTSTAARSSRPRSRCSRTATCGAARARRHRATSRTSPARVEGGRARSTWGGGGVARPRSRPTRRFAVTTM